MAEHEQEMNRADLNEVLFIQYVSILTNAAMQQLGKIMNPVTGKMERNLEAARATIDLLTMLKEKTQGNLNAREEKVIANGLANLQLNYADEVNRLKQENQSK
ncbi:MAG: DUF1844 domain-containing protein [Candidatus Omnitrophota bacterium]